MILTCPECATSYSVPDEALGAKGRRVRCQSCGHVWTATADEPLALTPLASPTTPAGAKPAPEPAPSESLAETPAPELPRAYRARAEQQRRIRRAAAHGAVWAGLASAFVGILGAAWLFRVDVVEVFPRAAAAYAAVGVPVNPVGLEFEALSARQSLRNPEMVVVSGALRNVRDHEVGAPAVRVALLDSHGGEIGHAVVQIDSAPVLPGGVQGFAVLIRDAGGKAADVGVDFLLEQTTPTAAPAHATPAEDEEHAPAEEPPPAPAHGAVTAHAGEPGPASGLRPALDIDHGAPVDVATPSAAALDSHAGEAVSAPHHG
ncbi:MJ0042-type zinc finger domain-containing protein [Brevundimonas balnearis]|uniref:MJ0042-type zinc finger domain-containing protein n=1 Tax=Brevundimonas balnearis TaxID=1572858 RepID=A0ABV6R035_9CAUL